MKLIKIFLGLFIISFIVFNVSCRAKKENQTNENNQTDTLRIFNVSFYSIGEGIDSKSRNAFESYIKESQNQYPELSYIKQPWGREGEVDYCVDITKLNSDIKIKMKLDIEKTLAESKNSRLTINKPCKTAK